MDLLPSEIVEKIEFIAHPRMSDELKRSIHVVSTLYSLNILDQRWYENCMNKFRVKWKDLIKQTYTQEEVSEVIQNLKKCGCCERHSKNVYKTPHCTSIVGSHTCTDSVVGGKCPCPCRHYMRSLGWK